VPLLCAAILLAILITLNRRGVRALWPYLLIGAALWIAVFLSGVHATLAGVATAMAVPLRPAHGKADTGASPLHRLEHKLNPLVAFAILPLFGFANAGVRLIGMGPEAVFGTVPLGIALGLILGKQIGIFGACAGMIRARLAPLPEGANWRQLYGMAILCGIGFTMSLFIGGLAFGEDAPLAAPVKIGVLGGSLVSALLGYLLLRGGRVAPAAAGGE
jgi:NhaA family Na+:H+ antiporter